MLPLDNKDKFYINVITEQQDEFLKRLDILNRRNNTTHRITTICTTILLVIWVLGFIIGNYIL